MQRSAAGLTLVALLAACGATTQPTVSLHPTPTAEPSPAASPSPAETTKPTPSASPEAALAFKLLAGGFGDLTFVADAGDGSGLLYVVEQAGSIRIVAADGTVQAAPFLDITERISSGGERGLLGLAFHPRYVENGRFFVDYTDTKGNTVVSEFRRSTATTADPASERILFTVEQPFSNHNGGMIAFGPDGALYVGLGDGGSEGDPQGNGQNPDTFLSKIVRLDVDAAPGTSSAPAIWDSGLRNPWRFSFDRQTGDLFIGDVGGSAWEEINAEPAGTGGRNYGWSIMEGPACYNATDCDQTGLTLPVASYSHSGGNGCAVTGGYVYRGKAIPDLVGTYLYSDYCSGIVWGLEAATAIAGGTVKPNLLGETGFYVSSFGEDEAGELYVVDHRGGVFRITGMPASLP